MPRNQCLVSLIDFFLFLLISDSGVSMLLLSSTNSKDVEMLFSSSLSSLVTASYNPQLLFHFLTSGESSGCSQYFFARFATKFPHTFDCCSLYDSVIL